MTKSKKPVNSFSLPKVLNAKQLELVKAITNHDMVITIGPAGTGKTYLTAAYAAYYYHTGKIDKIILTRPTVPVDRSIGFMPGTLEEKMAPWTAPFVSVLEEFLGKGQLDCMVKNGKFEVVPFEVIRGRSWKNSFIILDEAQNATYQEMKAFVTRLGEDSKTVINGDLEQSDLKLGTFSGLEKALSVLRNKSNEELANKVATVEFSFEDIVRSELCRLWVKAWG